jgi:hypothetical protein
MLPSTDSTTEPPAAERSENVLIAGTRVDGPHLLREVEPEGLDLIAASLAAREEVSAETSLAAARLEAQAEQLAGHLRLRQEELDRREAQLNARCAEFDQELRNARLWFAERQQDLARGEEKLAGGDSQSQQQPADDESRQQVQHAEAESLRSKAEAVALRERRLEEAETQLAGVRAETAALECELERRREQLEAQGRLDRRNLAELQRKNESELARKRQSLEQQSERLDHHRLAVERSREELSRMQREAIEMRLAAEELQAQLMGSLAPAALERSLGALRQRLSDYYRLEAAAVAEQAAELEGLKAELAAEHDKLSARQEELKQWVSARLAESQQQAGRLEAREQELERQEQARQEQERMWRDERFEQQQRIRRLQAELRDSRETAR